MPKFSIKSIHELSFCDSKLMKLFLGVVKNYDCSILCGHRTQHEQDIAYMHGNSKTPWPKSKHNSLPSKAVDVVPFPVKWPKISTSMIWSHNNVMTVARFYHFAGYVSAIADSMNIKIRWGGDWDGDHEFDDQKFNDLPHFELVEE